MYLFIYLLYYAIIKRSVKLNRLLYRHLRDTFMSKRKRNESEPAGYVATHFKKIMHFEQNLQSALNFGQDQRTLNLVLKVC